MYDLFLINSDIHKGYEITFYNNCGKLTMLTKGHFLKKIIDFLFNECLTIPKLSKIMFWSNLQGCWRGYNFLIHGVSYRYCQVQNTVPQKTKSVIILRWHNHTKLICCYRVPLVISCNKPVLYKNCTLGKILHCP